VYFVEIDIRIGNRTETKVLHDPHSKESVLYKGKITRMLNAINDFRFEMLYTHPLFKDEIRPYASMVRVRDSQNNIIFRGRVIDYTPKMNNNGQMVKEFVVECELAFLLDSVQRVREFSGSTRITTGEYVRRIIRRHNDRVEEAKKIHMVNVNGVDHNPDLPESQGTGELGDRYHITYDSTFKNITDNLLDEFGGYVWLDYRMSADGRSEQRVLYYEQRENEFWKPGNMPIRLAENLESIRSENLSSQALTRLVPLGIELNTPQNAIRRLVAAGIINNSDGGDPSRDYGQNVQWWMQNYNQIDPWMFQLLINLSRLNYIPCDGVDCENPGCRSGQTLGNLFDSATTADLWNVNNVRNSTAFSNAISLLNTVGAISNPAYWRASGRAGILPPYDILQGLNQDQRVSLMRLRWLVRKVERALNTCVPRFQGSDEVNARLNLGSPNWIEVDIEPALSRLEEAGILLPGGHWHELFEDRFRRTLSTWTGQLLLSLSVLNYLPDRVAAARQEVMGGPAIDHIAQNRREEWFAGIDRLADVGAIHNPDHWKERYTSRDIVALLWMTGQSVNLRNPHSPNAGSARNLFGTIVEKVVIWDDVTDCDELWRKGLTWIRNRALSNSISISALDLSFLNIDYGQFNIGKVYKAEHELLGINDEYRLIQQDIDVIDPLKSNLVFGDRQRKLSRTSSRAR
jgi:hypothetical protein